MFNLVQAEQAGCTVEDLQHFNLFNMLKFKSGTNFTMKKYIYYRFLKDPALLNYEITKPEFETEEQLVYNPNRVKMSPDERQLFKHIKQLEKYYNASSNKASD